MERASGILFPIFSLWGKESIGTLGEEAYQFIDFLANSHQKYWQVLPAGPTSYGDSPYQSYSSYAGNPYFIDLFALQKEGLLTIEDLSSQKFSPYINYEQLWNEKIPLLRKAFKNSGQTGGIKQQNFIKKHPQIEDYAVFMALKKHFSYVSRSLWTEGSYKKDLSPSLKEQLSDEISFHLFVQEIFYKQWSSLKAYAHTKKVKIIGDIPIYVAEDSADLWANPEFFQLEKDGRLSFVAGVPPDYFSETGQLWGNPLYNWAALKKDHFSWWVQRIKGAFTLYDVLRIDHFRGFEAFWAVPYGEQTAQNGQWVKAKGKELFETIKKELGEIEAIAEDLGVITPPVKKLIKETGFPGMKVLLFAFYAGQESDYMPHRYQDENCVVYTGTHDNETVSGWFQSGNQDDIASACEYLKLNTPSPEEFAWAYVEAAWNSKAKLAIAPLQDILALDNSARINTPSTLGSNWQWRMPHAPSKILSEKLASLTTQTGR